VVLNLACGTGLCVLGIVGGLLGLITAALAKLGWIHPKQKCVKHKCEEQ
jgi:hypothetical protein